MFLRTDNGCFVVCKLVREAVLSFSVFSVVRRLERKSICRIREEKVSDLFLFCLYNSNYVRGYYESSARRLFLYDQYALSRPKFGWSVSDNNVPKHLCVRVYNDIRYDIIILYRSSVYFFFSFFSLSFDGSYCSLLSSR